MANCITPKRGTDRHRWDGRVMARCSFINYAIFRPRERCVIYRGARYKKPDGVIAPTRTHAIVILEASSLPIKSASVRRVRDPEFGVDDEMGSESGGF